MIAIQSELCAALGEWWSRVPTMRFGQLIAASSLESDIEDASDDTLLRETLDRIRGGFQSNVTTDESASPALRAIIVTELDRLTRRFPKCPVGKLAARVAANVNRNLYDVEDQDFLSAMATFTEAANELRAFAEKNFDLEEARRISEEQRGQGITTKELLDRLPLKNA